MAWIELHQALVAHPKTKRLARRLGVNLPTAIGGALFLVSDGLIALNAFAEGFDLPGQGFWVMATYLAAQSLIVVGVLLLTGVWEDLNRWLQSELVSGFRVAL